MTLFSNSRGLHGGCSYDRPLTLITDSQADREATEALRCGRIRVIEVPV